MLKGRRQFQRKQGNRRYLRMFVLSTEGSRTEPMYFDLIKRHCPHTLISCLNEKNKSSPREVLKRMKDYLNRERLRKGDEAWLVIDRDQWTEEQLSELSRWEKESPSHGLALSNPKFEFWLLLHFEDGSGSSSAKECLDRLKVHLPEYNKILEPHHFPLERIKSAVARAKKRDHPPSPDWPRNPGSTTVYRLVENILDSTVS